MLNFLKKKDKGSSKHEDSAKEENVSKQNVGSDLNLQPPLPDKNGQENNFKKAEAFENAEGADGFNKEESVSFEVPDFSEEDLKLELEGDMPPGENDEDKMRTEGEFGSEEEKEPAAPDGLGDDDFTSEETEEASNDESEGIDALDSEDSEESEAISEVELDSEDSEENSFDDESEDVQDEEDSETIQEDSEDSEDVQDEEDEVVHGEDIPSFDVVKESVGPKFISKHRYKDIIFNIIESKETILDLVDVRKDFPKTEGRLNKEVQSIGKDIELIKERLADIDKKIFI